MEPCLQGGCLLHLHMQLVPLLDPAFLLLAADGTCAIESMMHHGMTGAVDGATPLAKVSAPLAPAASACSCLVYVIRCNRFTLVVAVVAVVVQHSMGKSLAPVGAVDP